MADEPAEIAELTEHIAAILELPEDEQPGAFQRLRDEHPESRAFLVRCEAAASQLAPGGDLRAPLVQSLAGFDNGNGALPERIGPYEILEVLGEGGMGTVYLAEQKEPIQRRVALKVIKLGMATKDVIARFEAERQALARMSHPTIAQVLDVGKTAEGQPYFAMEYVPGVPITDYCNQNEVSLEERIELFQQVCVGVQHAHQKFVLHRDIKPSNILVQVQDDKPVPKIIDFGVAKATDHSLTERSLYTEQGRLIGTPAYMSPEQAEMTGQDVDARADIYSLGVLLYQLLTGSLPFDARELQQAGLTETQRRIREDEPPRPSTRVTPRGVETAALTKRLQAEPSDLVRALKGDLDWITMRCLEKDPDRRYQSASELAADLQRHLEHEPVDAGPPSTAYRLRKFLRKRRGPVAAGVGIFLALVAGLLLALQKEREAKAALVSYQLMKDVPLAEDLLREAEHDLWPAHPHMVEAMDRWLDRARVLASRAASHGEKLQELRKKAGPPGPEVQHKLSELTMLQKDLDSKRTGRDEAKAASTKNGAALRRLRKLESELANLEAKLQTLDAETREKRWQFEDYEDRFLHEVFAGLVSNVDRFVGEGGLIAQVEARRKRAATLGVRSLEDTEENWKRVIAAIAGSEKYRGMPALTPQLGLVPLGTDPLSLLEEFAVLDTGFVPKRDANGSLQFDGASAIVLVLIPPGTFAMGAQSSDPRGPNYEPRAGESPVRRVKLDAFFLSKYEMTQGQWLRVMRTNPSAFCPGVTAGGRTFSAQNPVERVTWYDCSDAMRRLGLVLPTEAQWEYGARAGTTTAWWTGQERSSLVGAANTSDKHSSRYGGPKSWEYDLDLNDGHSRHAPVGSFRANVFGLHDVIGNVQEWCRDSWVTHHKRVPRPGDGLCEFVGSLRVFRGGSWRRVAHWARSAKRASNGPEHSYYSVGVRPSRVITH